MKNKKIIILTVFIISATVFGVLGMSNIFENIWQTTGEKDNSYTVNRENLQGDATVFNYPYFDVREYKSLTDINALERYSPEIKSYEQYLLSDDKDKLLISYDKEASSDMITYQEVANICGEAIKYMYGITEHQNIPVMIKYIYHNDANVLNQKYYQYVLFTESRSYIDMTIDPYSGEIKNITTSQMLVTDFNENIKANIQSDYLIVDIESLIINQTKENLDILGNNVAVDKYEISEKQPMDGFKDYRVEVWHTDGTRTSMRYITIDFEYFELWSYTTYKL